MPRLERDSSANASWLQAAQPDANGQGLERLPGLAFAFEQFALNIPAAADKLLKLDSAPALEFDPRDQPLPGAWRPPGSARRAAV